GGLDHLGGDVDRRRGPPQRVPPRRGQGRRGRGAAGTGHQVRAVVEDPAECRLRSRLSRRLAARRAGAARMGRHAQGGRMSTSTTGANQERSLSLLWGPLTWFGLIVAVVAMALDQLVKLWLIFVVDLGARGIVRLTPFLDLVLTW